VDVRVIAATNQDLPARVASGQFREDLYHRLNVINIELPPLRERPDDITMLLAHYLRITAAEMAVDAKLLSPAVEKVLTAYPWPGNVRELVNLSRRLTVLAPGREIQVDDLPADVRPAALATSLGSMDDWSLRLARWADLQLDGDGAPLLDVAAPEFERVLALAALKRTQGHRQEAAKRIGWGRNTLTRKLRELGIDEHAEP
jgi:two-component system, NtrC family, nitrogen regulation response regulator GlnG